MGGYWFVCPKCGAGMDSDKIENYCKSWAHPNEHWLMQQRGKIVISEVYSPDAASQCHQPED